MTSSIWNRVRGFIPVASCAAWLGAALVGGPGWAVAADRVVLAENFTATW